MNSTNRLMGDAITGNVGALLAVPGLQMVAPYVTGHGIAWTAGEFAAAQLLPQAPIDQGGQGSPVLTATVRDVENLAWTPLSAVDRTGWMAARPTIYCNRYDLTRAGGVLACGWQGDLWLAIPGWQPGDPLPASPGCTVVAVQNDFSHPAYDLSIVLDPTWPYVATSSPEDDMRIVYGQAGRVYLLDGGRASLIPTPTDLATYLGAGIPEVGGPRQGGLLLTTEGEAAFVKDFAPGNPAVTVTVPPLNISTSGTITHA